MVHPGLQYDQISPLPIDLTVNLVPDVGNLLHNTIDAANADVNTDSPTIFMSLIGRHFGLSGERVGNLEN